MGTTLDEVKFLQPAAVARITGCGLRNIQYKIQTGALRSILWGRKRLIPISALAESLGVPESELRPNLANDATSPAFPSKDLENASRTKKRTARARRSAVVILTKSKRD